MNVIITVDQDQTQQWVDLLFLPGPHPGPTDPDPRTYLLGKRLAQPVTGDFLYVTYRSEIIGYARIARVEPHVGDTVGEEDRPVKAGNRIVVEHPLRRMPFVLRCPGFRSFRYIGTNLHQVSQQQAQAAL